MSLDAYLAFLTSGAELQVSCGPGCSACCTDLAPTHPVEGLRMLRALAGAKDGPARVQRAVAHARMFQRILQQANISTPGTTATETYLRAQLAWRLRGEPCPALGEDGACGFYEARPLACRVYVSVQEPDRCVPTHPGYTTKERPPIWKTPAEARFEEGIRELGARLGLPGTPNLAWSLALLHAHPSVR